jgi:hypothetical protein
MFVENVTAITVKKLCYHTEGIFLDLTVIGCSYYAPQDIMIFFLPGRLNRDRNGSRR